MLRWNETVFGVLYSFEGKNCWLMVLRYIIGIYPDPPTQALLEIQGAEIEHQDNCRKAEVCTSLLSWNLNLNISRTFLGLLEIRTVCSMKGSYIQLSDPSSKGSSSLCQSSSQSEWEIGRSPTVSLLHILCASLKIRIRSSQPATRHRNGWVLVLAYSSETRDGKPGQAKYDPTPSRSPHAAQSPVSQIIWNTVRNPHILDNEGYSNISDNILISAWPVQLRHSCRAIFPQRASLFYIVCHSEAWPWPGWARDGVMDVFRRGALCRRGFWFWKQDKNCARSLTCPCSQKQISQIYINIVYAYCTDMCTCTW